MPFRSGGVKNTYDGDCVEISPPTTSQPPSRPPIGLLHEPRWAKVKGVTSVHREKVGEASCSFLKRREFLLLAIRGRYN